MADKTNINSKGVKERLIENFKKWTMSYQLKDDPKKRKEVLTEFNTFKDKIENNSLSINDYCGENGLADFLAGQQDKQKSICFGSSKANDHTQYGIYKKDEKFCIRDDKKNYEENDDDLKKKLKEYLENFRKIINYSTDSQHSDSFEQIIDKFPSKMLCKKLYVLSHIDKVKLGFFYQDKTIDAIYAFFVPEGKAESYPEKNNQIMEAIIKNLNPNLESKNYDGNEKDWHCLSDFVWDLFLHGQAGLEVSEESPNVIYYGAPGTGKTYEVNNALRFLRLTQPHRVSWIQFHPTFSYEDFIDGLKPIGLTDGVMKFDLVNGVFKQFCIDAKNDPENEYYFVVDEINRANLSNVFGETLSCLEASYRWGNTDERKTNLISTQNSRLQQTILESNENKESNNTKAFFHENGKILFGVPKNIRFIGMMNDVDKSIDAFDLALRRRFKWIRKDCNYGVVEEELQKNSYSNVDKFIDSCKKLNAFISDENKLGLGKSYEFGHSFFLKMNVIVKNNDSNSENHKKTLFDEYLRPTLKEYLRSEINSESELEKKLEEAKNIFVK